MATICDGCSKRVSVAGSSHSKCEAMENPVLGMALFAAGSPSAPKAKAHGVRMGWCMWPIDFDPVWIESCPLKVKAGTGSVSGKEQGA